MDKETWLQELWLIIILTLENLNLWQKKHKQTNKKKQKKKKQEASNHAFPDWKM